MNNKLLVTIVLVLLLGGGAYVYMGKSKAPASESTMKATPTEAAESKTVEGTLKSLIAAAIPQTCSFTNKTGADTKGTVFTSGGKMRGDFVSTTSKGTTSNGHMIVDAELTYVWTDEMKQGFKMKITDEQKNEAANSNQAVDLNQNISYSCSPWLPDASKFELPKDVSFMEFSMPTAGTGGTKAMPSCAVCAGLTGAAQTACKTQLGCN